MEEDERFAARRRTLVVGAESETGPDAVAREEPLEIRINGVSIAVVMRTPGHDELLVTGFLLTERIVGQLSDVQSIRHCDTTETPESDGNVILVRLAGDRSVDLQRLRRNLFASSSCGICGKATLESALAAAPAIEDPITVERDVLRSLPDKLRGAQEVFDRTGGLHGVAAFAADGTLIAAYEDVGRHNAVDKVVGALARGDASAPLLMVSGRVSYEVVQKALAARIPILAAISAPTSLAVDLANAAGITLVGFLRGDRMSVYAGAQRLR